MLSSLTFPNLWEKCFVGPIMYIHIVICTLSWRCSFFILSYPPKNSDIYAIKLNNMARHQNSPPIFSIYLQLVILIWLSNQIKALKLITKYKFPRICYYPASWPLKILDQLFYVTMSEFIPNYKWGNPLFWNEADNEKFNLKIILIGSDVSLLEFKNHIANI